MDSRSRRRAVRMARSQAELDVLRVLPKDDILRYKILKERWNAYMIQRMYRRCRGGKALTQRRGIIERSVATAVRADPAASASNSLFVSTLPSTVVNEDVSGDSQQLLLDVTSATADLPPVASHPQQPQAMSTQRGAKVTRASAAAYKEAVGTEGNKLDDLHHHIAARAVRRAQGASVGHVRSASADAVHNRHVEDMGGQAALQAGQPGSLAAAGQRWSVEYQRRLAALERLRNKSDALYYQHARGANARGGAVALHHRRVKLSGRVSTLVTRLSNPAQPMEVLQRAATAGEAGQVAQGLRRAFDGTAVGADVSGADAGLVTAPGETLPPSAILPTSYRHALNVVRWPSSLSAPARESAVKAHKAAVETLGPSRRWWQVYHPDSGAQVDVRDVQASLEWPASASVAMRAGQVQPQVNGPSGHALKVNGPGWVSIKERSYLPSHAREFRPVLVPGPDVKDPVALATDGLVDLGAIDTGLPGAMGTRSSRMGTTALAGTGSGLTSVGRRATSAPPLAKTSYRPARHAFAGYDGPESMTVSGAAVSSRPRAAVPSLTDGEASDLWLAYVCSPLPLFSQIDVEAAEGLNEDQKQAVGSRLLASLRMCVAPGQAVVPTSDDGATRAAALTGSSAGTGTAADTPATRGLAVQLQSLDSSLASAARALGVVDPWSTAAAYIDPSAVSSAVRAASAAAAKADTVLTEDGAGSNAAGIVTGRAAAASGATGPSAGPSVEDLLNMTTELSSAPPFDFYSSIRSMAEEEAKIEAIKAAAEVKLRYRSRKADVLAGRLPGGDADDGNDGGASGLDTAAAAGAAIWDAVRRTGAGLGLNNPLALPSLAAPAESISRRVDVAYEALKRRVETADALELPSTGGLALVLGGYGQSSPRGGSPDRLGSGPGTGRLTHSSMAQLTRDVAARKIQHAWRGVLAMHDARMEAKHLREQRGLMAPHRQAAMQAAVVQLVNLLETATGMDMQHSLGPVLSRFGGTAGLVGGLGSAGLASVGRGGAGMGMGMHSGLASGSGLASTRGAGGYGPMSASAVSGGGGYSSVSRPYTAAATPASHRPSLSPGPTQYLASPRAATATAASSAGLASAGLHSATPGRGNVDGPLSIHNLNQSPAQQYGMTSPYPVHSTMGSATGPSGLAGPAGMPPSGRRGVPATPMSAGLSDASPGLAYSRAVMQQRAGITGAGAAVPVDVGLHGERDREAAGSYLRYASSAGAAGPSAYGSPGGNSSSMAGHQGPSRRPSSSLLVPGPVTEPRLTGRVSRRGSEQSLKLTVPPFDTPRGAGSSGQQHSHHGGAGKTPVGSPAALPSSRGAGAYGVPSSSGQGLHSLGLGPDVDVQTALGSALASSSTFVPFAGTPGVSVRG